MSENEDLPIAGLADLEAPVSENFIQLLRRKLYRRTTTAQLAHFSWSAPSAILIELVSIIVHLFSVLDGKKGRSQ